MPTILVVDDDPHNRDILKRRLGKRGFEIATTIDRHDVVEKSRSASPDLILMDMTLPGMDGWQATRVIKDQPDTSHIPIVALTAHDLESDRERAAEVGCDAFEPKPIRFERLLETISGLIPDSGEA